MKAGAALIGRQLLLLLWKGTKLKIRHFIVTAFEFLLPLLLICLMVYARSTFPIGGTAQKTPAVVYQAENLYPISEISLYYAPNTTLASKFVNAFRGNYTFEHRKVLTSVKGVKTEQELYDLATQEIRDGDYSTKVIGLVFENLDADVKEIPETLKYKIRMPGYFHTEGIDTSFGLSNSEYRYSGFLSFQFMVDQAFLDLSLMQRNSSFTNLKPYIRQLVYPAHYNASSFLSFMSFMPLVFNYTFIFMAVVFVKRLVDEKANRAKELMRMMGMNDLVYFTGNWLVTFLSMSVLLTITIILFKIPLGQGQQVIAYSDGFLVWIIFILYAGSCLHFCMLISTFFNRHKETRPVVIYVTPVVNLISLT